LRGTYIKPALTEFGRAYELTRGSTGANPDFSAIGVPNSTNPTCDIPGHPSLSCVPV
jgi:hypothetical protein